MFEPGALIGPYRVLGPLGSGGMAVVYRAQHVESHRLAAVKTVQVPNPQRLAAIRREIQALTRIRHPGIVRIVGQGLDGGRPWYAMDLIEGETLRAYLRRRWGTGHRGHGSRTNTNVVTDVTALEVAPFMAGLAADALLPSVTEGLPATLEIFARLCQALAFLHGEGIINGDLKPENVLLLSPENPLIIDFGLTSSFGAADGREALESARGTEGTAAYISPEQIRNEFVDARADLYAVGCMLYEAVTGSVPFSGTPGQMLHQHLHEIPRSPSELVRDLPAALEQLILRLLKKPLHERVGYAEDVALALREIAGGPRPSPTLSQRPYLYRPRFSGRSDSLAKVAACIERTRAASGALVLVGGESGVGKTRFAMEATLGARRARLRVVTGQSAAGPAGATAVSAPFQPLRPLLQAIADRCQQGGAELTQRLLGERGRLLATYEPALAAVPGLPAEGDLPPLPDQAARRRVVASVRETVAAFAADQPLLLVLDDLQWADELTLAFLRSLDAEFLARTPVVVLGLYRKEESGDELRRIGQQDHVTNLMLDRLDRASVAAIVGDMLAIPPPPPEGLVTFLLEHTEGNPFFVAEYLRAAMAAGTLIRRPLGSWKLANTNDVADGYQFLPLPRSLHDLISDRLRTLPDRSAALIEMAAVLGRQMEQSLLLEAAGLGFADGSAALDDLVNRQMFEQGEAGELRFVHDKVREVAYDAIQPARRRELHARAAKTMEASSRERADASFFWPRLGHHLAVAEEFAAAADYLARAAREARLMYANDESIALYRAALDSRARVVGDAGAAPSPMALRESLADLLALTGRRGDARLGYQEAIDGCAATDHAGLARLHRKLGKTWETEHRHEDALRCYEQARTALAAAGQAITREGRAEWIQVHIEQLWVHYWLNRVDAMNALIGLLQPLIADAAPLQRARFFECQMLLSFRRDRYLVTEETLSYAKAAVEACRAGNELSALPGAQLILGLALLVQGAPEKAEDELQPVLTFARRAGDNILQVRCLTYLTLGARMRGRTAEVRAYNARLAEVAGALEMLEYIAVARANEAWLSLHEGDLEAAVSQAENALTAWRNRIFPFQWTAMLPLMAVHLRRGDISAAVECAEGLLAPTQQYLPGIAADSLARAIRTWRAGDSRSAESSLRLSLRQLEPTGYR